MQSPTCNSDQRGRSIAVDFGGTKISAASIAGDAIVDRKREATDQSASPETHLETIIGLIESLGPEGCDRLGVATCGRVDKDGNWYAMNSRTLRDFSVFPLRERLEDHFGCRVNVMNDAAAAAWGEYQACADSEEIDPLLYVTVSTGVGGALVLDGRPLQSSDGLANHMGFMSSPFGSELCGSGRRGTIESVASGTAIGRAASAATGSELSGYDAYQAHLAGDADATAVVDRSARAIAKVITDVRALLGIRLATIGGSVGLAEGYIDRVRDHVGQEPEIYRCRVIPARLGADSALFGIVS